MIVAFQGALCDTELRIGQDIDGRTVEAVKIGLVGSGSAGSREEGKHGNDGFMSPNKSEGQEGKDYLIVAVRHVQEDGDTVFFGFGSFKASLGSGCLDTQISGMGRNCGYLELELELVGTGGSGTGSSQTGSGSNSENLGSGLTGSDSNSENSLNKTQRFIEVLQLDYFGQVTKAVYVAVKVAALMSPVSGFEGLIRTLGTISAVLGSRTTSGKIQSRIGEGATARGTYGTERQLKERKGSVCNSNYHSIFLPVLYSSIIF
ncbi:hypothetical protein LXL04_014314 [Taraxacum kok-saghyz]